MDFFIDADMAELADAPDLGSGGRPCRFKSCYPQLIKALKHLCVSMPLFLCAAPCRGSMPQKRRMGRAASRESLPCSIVYGHRKGICS